AFALACIAILVDSMKYRVINEDLLLKIFLPTAALGFFSLLLFGPILRLICIGLMVVGLTLQMAIGLSAISGHVNLFRLSPIRVFGYGRAATAFGLAVGWVLGGLAREGAIFGDAAIVVVSVVLMTVFIFISSFVMENHYPFQENQKEGAEGGGDLALQTNGVSSGDAGGSEGEAERGIWRKRCEAVAALYDLSPRQREVLILLAKGRNAEYIQEKLVVSNHTAKAHIYNIYQKTNVHSRQELIDLIEAIDLPGGNEK
ncbi:MAG: helix-turn-helix transcriptional regulator, partial [Actinobacteria bacterium]|nr:helix-turn-helix transcriptional regulator [Actinomycetota bacterium]